MSSLSSSLSSWRESGSSDRSSSKSESNESGHSREKIPLDLSHRTLRQPMEGPASTSSRNGDCPSNLADGYLDFIRDRYKIHDYIGMRYPVKGKHIDNPPAGHVAFYLKMFEFGVCFPLNPFAKKFVLTEVNLTPTQLAPNC